MSKDSARLDDLLQKQCAKVAEHMEHGKTKVVSVSNVHDEIVKLHQLLHEWLQDNQWYPRQFGMLDNKHRQRRHDLTGEKVS